MMSTMAMGRRERWGTVLPDGNADTARSSVACDLEYAARSKTSTRTG